MPTDASTNSSHRTPLPSPRAEFAAARHSEFVENTWQTLHASDLVEAKKKSSAIQDSYVRTTLSGRLFEQTQKPLLESSLRELKHLADARQRQVGRTQTALGVAVAASSLGVLGACLAGWTASAVVGVAAAPLICFVLVFFLQGPALARLSQDESAHLQRLKWQATGKGSVELRATLGKIKELAEQRGQRARGMRWHVRLGVVMGSSAALGACMRGGYPAGFLLGIIAAPLAGLTPLLYLHLNTVANHCRHEADQISFAQSALTWHEGQDLRRMDTASLYAWKDKLTQMRPRMEASVLRDAYRSMLRDIDARLAQRERDRRAHLDVACRVMSTLPPTVRSHEIFSPTSPEAHASHPQSFAT